MALSCLFLYSPDKLIKPLELPLVLDGPFAVKLEMGLEQMYGHCWHSENNNIKYTRELDNLVKTGRVSLFAQTQTHHSMEGRAFVREAGLNEFREQSGCR